MTDTTPDNYWQGFAQRWNRLGSPLRPCAEDVANFRKAMGDDPGRCLLLGVTPELADLSPTLTAIDNSAAMIAALWHGRQRAILGDWLEMPFAPASFDTVIGDGCLVLLAQPMQHQRFFERLAKIVAPGGRILLRVFVGPEQPETREEVCRDALAGKMRSVHAFKWRLSMAVASEAPDRTLAVAETAATFDRLIPDRKQLAAATGWRADEIETIDFYRGSDARYCYPTLSQVRNSIPASLKETSVIYGSYELAGRCPILVLEPRA
ncbi:MAG: class I SAM-dependent methyltransferase [Nitrosomonadales bacterium]|nr:class I SAM-dependent methyltransferase [Nitrosomonadales bacterium]